MVLAGGNLTRDPVTYGHYRHIERHAERAGKNKPKNDNIAYEDSKYNIHLSRTYEGLGVDDGPGEYRVSNQLGDARSTLERHFGPDLERVNRQRVSKHKEPYADVVDYAKSNKRFKVASNVIFDFASGKDLYTMMDNLYQQEHDKGHNISPQEFRGRFFKACSEGMANYANGFNQRNPYLTIVSATTNVDEHKNKWGAPHLHASILNTGWNKYTEDGKPAPGAHPSMSFNDALRGQYPDMDPKDYKGLLKTWRKDEEDRFVHAVGHAINQEFDRQQQYKVSPKKHRTHFIKTMKEYKAVRAMGYDPEDIDHDLTQLSESVTFLSDTIDAKQAEINKLRDKNYHDRKENKRMAMQNKRLVQRTNDKDEKNKKLQEQLKKKDDRNKYLYNQNKDLKLKYDEMSSSRDDAIKQQEMLQKQIDKQQKEIAKMKKQLAQKDKQNAKLNDDLTNMSIARGDEMLEHKRYRENTDQILHSLNVKGATKTADDLEWINDGLRHGYDGRVSRPQMEDQSVTPEQTEQRQQVSNTRATRLTGTRKPVTSEQSQPSNKVSAVPVIDWDHVTLDDIKNTLTEAVNEALEFMNQAFRVKRVGLTSMDQVYSHDKVQLDFDNGQCISPTPDQFHQIVNNGTDHHDVIRCMYDDSPISQWHADEQKLRNGEPLTWAEIAQERREWKQVRRDKQIGFTPMFKKLNDKIKEVAHNHNAKKTQRAVMANTDHSNDVVQPVNNRVQIDDTFSDEQKQQQAMINKYGLNIDVRNTNLHDISGYLDEGVYKDIATDYGYDECHIGKGTVRMYNDAFKKFGLDNTELEYQFFNHAVGHYHDREALTNDHWSPKLIDEHIADFAKRYQDGLDDDAPAFTLTEQEEQAERRQADEERELYSHDDEYQAMFTREAHEHLSHARTRHKSKSKSDDLEL